MDKKNYILLNDGSCVLERSEWEADAEKLANRGNANDPFPNGTQLKIYTEGEYEAGCDYGFAVNGHWYLY